MEKFMEPISDRLVWRILSRQGKAFQDEANESNGGKTKEGKNGKGDTASWISREENVGSCDGELKSDDSVFDFEKLPSLERHPSWMVEAKVSKSVTKEKGHQINSKD